MTTATVNVQGVTNEPMGAAIGAVRAKGEPGKAAIWTGRVLSGLVVAFLLLASALPKLFMGELAADATQQLGWDAKYMLTIAIIEIAGALLYAIPRTAVFGAVFLTGLLGGAIATHLRIDNPLLSHTLFPVYLGALMWGGLWLRNPRVRALLPLGS